MAMQTHNTSDQLPQVEEKEHATPFTSYIGLAIILAIALAMVFLQAKGPPGF